jgi:DNA helicase IV
MQTKLLSRFYEKVKRSYEHLYFLQQKWELFERKHTYLTSRDQQEFRVSLMSHQPNKVKDFFYSLIADKTHKTMLTERNRIYRFLQQRLTDYNDVFIAKRLQEYHSLFEGIDDGLKTPLDANQRTAVVVDDQHNLLVAAAGSGKTMALITRIAYLVRREDAVQKSRILALTFNKSAAEEMRQRLKTNFHIDVDMRTFHGFGNSILRENSVKFHDVKATEDLVPQIFANLLKTNYEFQRLFIEYLSSHLQEERSEADFATKEEYFEYMQHQRYLTLSGIQVKSLAEKEIANFFFMHNIPVEYERLVTWVPQNGYKRYKPDFYLPQYDIYIEHWGLDRRGRTAPWIDTTKYKKDREWKLAMFRQKRKVLVETWDYERTEGTLIDHLKKSLQRVIPSIIFRPLSYVELVNKVYEPLQDNTREVKNLIATVITHAKSNFLQPQDLERRLQSGSYKKKTQIFGAMALIVYQVYEKFLHDNNFIDYNDMINMAIGLIRSQPEKYANRYDHILVDEFQDTSNQRLELIKCFVNDHTMTKLFCVGDDWQSINRFSGSEVAFFVDFERYFAQPAINYLQTNYRSVKSIVDVSTKLISFNKQQRAKRVQANNTTLEKIHLFQIGAAQSGNNFNKGQARHVFDTINNLLKSGEKPQEIMVISRFNKTLKPIEWLFADNDQSKYEKIRLQSVHKSKGAEATHVFILSVISGVYGFPSEIQDDSVLELVKPQLDKTALFEEERRLFYVALTRSKRHLYIYTQEGAESMFLTELAGFEGTILQRYKIGNEINDFRSSALL